MKIHTYDTKKRKKVLVGELSNGVFIKKVIPSKHKMKMFDAYGIQKDCLIRLVELGCQTIKIIEPERELNSDIANWFEEGMRSIDFGSGVQTFLPVYRMQETAGV